MSPSEDELRAALHHGEGDSVDVDRVLLHAAAARHQRRVRILAVAAAVVAVAGIGVGGTVLFSDGHDGHHSALAVQPNRDTLRLGSATTTPQPLASTGGEVSSSRPAASSVCPARLPQVNMSQPVPSAQSTGPLFDGAVAELTVCAYFADQLPVSANGVPVSQSFTVEETAAIEQSLAAADTARRQGAECSAMIPLSAKTLVLLASRPDGSSLPPVIAPIDRPTGCNPMVTNGTAARFNWIPPAALSDYLAEINTISPLPPGGMNSASPAH